MLVGWRDGRKSLELWGAGVILRGSFALKGVLLLWFIFLLLEKGYYMNIAPEMLIIDECLFWGHKYFSFSS